MFQILVVEDDRNLADTLKEYFASKLYQIVATSDGNEGYALAKSNHYDLILLDVMLPGRSGYVAAQQLRRLGVETPILMITGKNSLEDIITGMQCGADGYLTKPFRLRELKPAVTHCLKGRPIHGWSRSRSPACNSILTVMKLPGRAGPYSCVKKSSKSCSIFWNTASGLFPVTS